MQTSFQAWGAIGPLVGVVVGALLTRSWERRKWVKDVRLQECRELLKATSDAATRIMERQMLGGVSAEQVWDLYLASVQVFQTRLFIAKEVENQKLLDIWAHAVHDYQEKHDRAKFDEQFETLKAGVTKDCTEAA